MSDSVERYTSEFLANRDGLMAFILGLVRESHAAEDIFQEVWVQLYKAVKDGVSIEDSAKWCRGVARNLILRHWRKSQNERGALNEGVLQLVEQSFDENDSASDVWLARKDALAECLKKLPEKSRSLLKSKYCQQLSLLELSRMTQRPVGSLKVTLCRLRQALLECVESRMRMEGAASQ
jgi:RNA polymerase sigma-70 factor (ECF subfamily)